jgi:enoyl-CoA hydratase
MAISVTTKDRITIITIDRPAARNAVDPETSDQLFTAFLAFEADPAVDVAILTGDSTAFCAGFDLKVAAQKMPRTWVEKYRIPDDWQSPHKTPLPSPMGPARLMLSKPVIAAIEGGAVAGGMELALWCSLRVSSASAYFGIYCRRWGVPLIDGGTVRLPQIIGQGRANELILTGRTVHSDEALRIGLVNQITDDGLALMTAISLATSLQQFPRACMLSDYYNGQMSPQQLADGLRREWKNSSDLLESSVNGARKFTAGEGRAGRF